ncbi:MAG: ABC transporter ATP-binding protein [Firmicutes bacterium]|nr:ABC transporter ATP-binding protein [Bacillota bacterium]
MLKFDSITKGYGGRQALFNVNLQFEPGCLCALVGPNGSGKSTLMKIGAGLVKPTHGTASYNGMPIGKESKAKIAYMSTEPFYYSYMNIGNVGRFYEDFYQDFDPRAYAELIRFMELSMDMKVKSLSSGMAAKLKIAATLARNAEVVMLDEPLNGIDLIGRDQIINSIIRYTGAGRTFIISSHLLDELEPITDTVVMLRNGQVILNGRAEAIREQYGKSIVELYREIYSVGYPNVPGQPPYGAPGYPPQGFYGQPPYGAPGYPPQGAYGQPPYQNAPQAPEQTGTAGTPGQNDRPND